MKARKHCYANGGQVKDVTVDKKPPPKKPVSPPVKAPPPTIKGTLDAVKKRKAVLDEI